MSEDLLRLVERIDLLIETIGIPTLVATGPDMFGDYALVPKDQTAAVAAVVSNLREADVVKASALLITILWHHAPDIAALIRASASIGKGE